MLPASHDRIEDLERCASVLEASGHYRVLRRLRLTAAPLPEGVPTRRGIIVDVETTGLDPATDEVLELAMVAFDYSIDGASVSAVASFDQLQDPGRPIPPEVTKLTGITDETVVGKNIDLVAADAFMKQATLVIAHNAAFDRRFCERLVLRRKALGLLPPRGRLE